MQVGNQKEEFTHRVEAESQKWVLLPAATRSFGLEYEHPDHHTRAALSGRRRRVRQFVPDYTASCFAKERHRNVKKVR